MSKFIDITGERYNNLVVVERAENAKGGVPVWKCKCDCGNITYVRGQNLKSGAVKSCGCLKHKERQTHHLSGTRLYRIWTRMKYRCMKPSVYAYKDYGGRGITVCDEWLDSFESFYYWAYANGYDDTLTIERIDCNGNYCPENCKWIPWGEQADNRRTSLRYTFNGATKNLAEWCEQYNVDYYLAHNRIYKLGWDFEKALFTPCNINKRNTKGKQNG